mgnify:FL=1
MVKAVWLSYDLGAQGDYESLYRWLDNLGALECGDSIAYFKYMVGTDVTDDNFIETLKNDISSNIQLTKRSRFYVIWRKKSSNKVSGKFIIGNRSASPWEGFGDKATTEEESE